MANDVNLVAGVGGVGRDPRSLPPGTVTITPTSRQAANTLGSQHLVANGLAFDRKGTSLYVGDTARGAIWRVELDRQGRLLSPVGCDTTFAPNTLCLDNVIAAHPTSRGRRDRARPRRNVWACVERTQRDPRRHVAREVIAVLPHRAGCVASAQRGPAGVPDEPVPARPDALRHAVGRLAARQLPEHRRRGRSGRAGPREDLVRRPAARLAGAAAARRARPAAATRGRLPARPCDGTAVRGVDAQTEREEHMKILRIAALAALVLVAAALAGTGRPEPAQGQAAPGRHDRITVNGSGAVATVPESCRARLRGRQPGGERAGRAHRERRRLRDASSPPCARRASPPPTCRRRRSRSRRATPSRASEVVGYTAQTTVTVTLRALDRAGAVIDAAVSAGANTVSGPALSSSDQAELYRNALRNAVADARAKAQALAAASGVTLGEVVSVVEAGGRADAGRRARGRRAGRTRDRAGDAAHRGDGDGQLRDLA